MSKLNPAAMCNSQAETATSEECKSMLRKETSMPNAVSASANRRTGLYRTLIAMIVVAALPALLALEVQQATPAGAQSNYVYDETPERDGISGGRWWRHDSGGLNGSFWYTIAIGNESDESRGSFATWDFSSIHGRYEVQTYIPSERATAHPRYRIWNDRDSDGSFGGANEFLGGPWVDQAQISGRWQSLGEYDFSGNVLVQVKNTIARDDYRSFEDETTGYIETRLAVDAMRLRRLADANGHDAVDVPSAPRDLELDVDSEGTLTITWKPPADDGGSTIVGYSRVVSRADGTGRKIFTRQIDGDRGSTTFRTLRCRVQYKVEIAALNSKGRGATASAETDWSGPEAPPPSPINLVVDALEDADNRLRATWELPKNGTGCGVHFEVQWSRDAVGDDPAWGPTAIEHGTSRTLHGRTGVPYDFRVVAIRAGRRSSPSCERDVIPLPRPRILGGTVSQEGRSWVIDDPDAVIYWNPVEGVQRYALDWRYMRIDHGRLREIYHSLNSGSLTRIQRTELEKEADELLDGSEISASLIRGDSSPNLDSEVPEVYFHNNGSYTQNTSRGSHHGSWDPESDPVSFRIHSRNDDYVLQARVKAIKSGWHGPWSDWAFHPNSKFSAGCRSLEFYQGIQDILLAVDIGGWVITVAGVATAIFSGGSSVPVSQAIRQVALQLARKIATDVTIKKVLKQIAKQAIEIASDSLRSNFLGFIFGCATHAVGQDLSTADLQQLGEEIIEASWEDFKDADWTEVHKDLLIDALGG